MSSDVAELERPIAGLPANWTEITLGDIVSLEYGKSLPDKSRRPRTVPVYGSNGVVGWHDEPLVTTGGIIVGRKGTAGSVTVSVDPFWPIDTTYFVKARQTLDWDWLAATLQHARLNELNEATGVPGLNRDKAYRQPILFPPLDEQRRIAEVLRSVDEAILAADAVISGLLNVATEIAERAFADPDAVELDCEIVTFGELFDIKGGNQPPKSSFVYQPREGYVRLLQIRDFESDDKAAYIAEASTKARCAKDDILIARYGASVGRILTGKTGAYNVALTKIVFRGSRIMRRYAYHWLKSEYFQDRIRAVSNRSAQAGFNKEDLFPTEIALPSLAVQEDIAEALDDIEKAIWLNRNEREQLIALKSGLLGDLLSGRVRVPA